MKTPNALDGKAGMSLITNKLESSLDLHDLEQFIDKKYCETRQRYRINCYNSNNLGGSKEIQPSLNRSIKYGTFEYSPYSTLIWILTPSLIIIFVVEIAGKRAIGKRAMDFWKMVS